MAIKGNHHVNQFQTVSRDAVPEVLCVQKLPGRQNKTNRKNACSEQRPLLDEGAGAVDAGTDRNMEDGVVSGRSKGPIQELAEESKISAKVIPFRFKAAQIRIVADNQGEPWFVAADVCGVLGYQNTPDAIAKHCRQKGIAKRDTLTEKGMQSMLYINEGNLYRLIIKSRKPEAEPFEAWVCDEVLPTIRKTGRYEALALPNHITEAQAGELSALVAERFPDGRKRPYAWGRFNNHFRLSGYKTLPATLFAEACEYIRAMPDKDAEKALPPPAKAISDKYSVENWLKYNPWIKPDVELTTDGKKRFSMTAFMVYSMDTRSATQMLINELTEKGHNVEACRIELNALKVFISNLRFHMQDIANIAQSSLDQTVMVKYSPAG